MELLTKHITEQQTWKILESVSDPEVPVLSVVDLGIIREVICDENHVEIVITPTYSGCPAMDVISMNIRIALFEEGITSVKISQQLSPAWTTDWMTQSGKEKLSAYGIAPPVAITLDEDHLKKLQVPCPLCRSVNTQLISHFGSTSCKALYQCMECREPFDYFKCH